MKRYVLDVVGEVCPVPLLLAAEQGGRLAAGDQLEIITDNDRSLRNLLRWAQKNGYDFQLEEEMEAGLWRLILQRANRW